MRINAYITAYDINLGSLGAEIEKTPLKLLTGSSVIKLTPSKEVSKVAYSIGFPGTKVDYYGDGLIKSDVVDIINSILIAYAKKSDLQNVEVDALATKDSVTQLEALVRALQVGIGGETEHPMVFLEESAMDALTAQNTVANYIYLGLEEIEGDVEVTYDATTGRLTDSEAEFDNETGHITLAHATYNSTTGQLTLN